LLYKTYSVHIQKTWKAIDWKFLIFLLLLLNVKLSVKALAILWICLYQFHFRFGFHLRNSRLPLFYPVVMAAGIFNWIFLFGFTNAHYTLSVITGIGLWAACLLASHQVKRWVETTPADRIYQTIQAFFIINTVVSLAVFLSIVFKTGAVNPYLYQGEYQKYFIGTGDYIKGISFDTSTTNAVLNAMGVIFFISRKNAGMTILCMVILLLTGSNVTNLLLGACLVCIFIFGSDRDQKSFIAICFLFLVIFLAKVSPQNNQYVASLFEKNLDIPKSSPHPSSALPVRERPDSILSPGEQKQKIAVLFLDSLYAQKLQKKASVNIPLEAVYRDRPVITGPDIHSAPYQHRSFVTSPEITMKQFIAGHQDKLPLSAGNQQAGRLPGKLLALEQTLNYVRKNPLKILTGAGMGNFSSKLAFKTTDLGIAGGYPRKWIYIDSAFMRNHLDLYLYFFTREDGLHSIANNPNSVYDQLMGEYGLTGILAFFLGYAAFFIKRSPRGSYGIPLLLLLSGLFFVDYWFEQLSVVVFFELLMFLNMKKEVSP
jgi:hypothetical protein